MMLSLGGSGLTSLNVFDEMIDSEWGCLWL